MVARFGRNPLENQDDEPAKYQSSRNDIGCDRWREENVLDKAVEKHPSNGGRKKGDNYAKRKMPGGRVSS